MKNLVNYNLKKLNSILNKLNKCNIKDKTTFRNTKSFHSLSIMTNNSINIKSKLNTKQFYKNIHFKTFTQNFQPDKEIFNTYNEEFDKALSQNDEDQEKRVRLLSLKLLQINNSRELINLFEEKYVKGLVSNIFGEELALFIYFYVSILNRESGDVENQQITKTSAYVDKRIEKILNMLNNKMQELDVVNLLAICWAVSLLITKFNYPVSDAMRKNIINCLPLKLENDKKGEVPTICFSISSFLSEDAQLEELIKSRITNYSNLFFSEEGLNYISALNISLIMMSWTKVKFDDVDCLNAAARSLEELEENLTEENIEEVCKIFWAFYVLNYKGDEKLQNILKSFIERNFDKIGVNHALDLFISFSSINSDNLNVFELLIDLIMRNYQSSEVIMDINNYVNIWLGLSKFYLQCKEKSLESVSMMLSFLMQNYNTRPYLKVTNMTLDEMCSMLVCLSALSMDPNVIFSDLGNSIKENLSRFNNIQLIQILSCGKYLFNTKKHSDLYYLVHDALITSKSTFDNIQSKAIAKILKNDGIITDSIFLDNARNNDK